MLSLSNVIVNSISLDFWTVALTKQDICKLSVVNSNRHLSLLTVTDQIMSQ